MIYTKMSTIYTYLYSYFKNDSINSMANAIHIYLFAIINVLETTRVTQFTILHNYYTVLLYCYTVILYCYTVILLLSFIICTVLVKYNTVLTKYHTILTNTTSFI
jgi:hypothetical protein